MKTTLFVLATSFAAGAWAQTDDALVQKKLAEAKAKVDMQMAAVKTKLASAQFGIVGTVVKGAPYSAEAVTESVQVLSDGNRIHKQTVTLVARDGDGRLVQQEESPQGGPPRTLSILDPVANVTYVFNHKAQTVYQRPLAVAGSDGVATKLSMAKKTAEGMVLKNGDEQQRTESLGKKTMEGIVVEGTRVTTTIPSGAIGNDRPIEITSERWYSPDLQLNVFTQRHDPRSGDVTFQLTNVRRAEPARYLFEIPPGYTVSQQDAEVAAKKAAERATKE